MSRIPQLVHLQFSLEIIKLATNDFSTDSCIGRGGFGRVYRGVLPASSGRPGTTVAIKRLDVKGGQGENEFLKEIVMLANYKHDNLASLVGFCDEGGEKIIIYKHEARGSLDKYLTTPDLPWVQRLLICLGAARGLNYLHSGVGEGHRVLHRDIKSSNVLLNENWEAKISDFGLSKIGPMNQQFTFLVTAYGAGTPGYIDPLYTLTGAYTKESDVYSFGVVLFEVLCGRRAYEGYSDSDDSKLLSRLAKLHYESGNLDELIIPGLRQQMKLGSLQTFSSIAYQCLKLSQEERPTMDLIIEQLQISLDFQIGCRRMTELWGSSTNGSPWSLQLHSNQKLRKITIDHEDWIYSIGFTIEDFNGSLYSYQCHGGTGGRSGGSISEVNFDSDEEIIGIDGTVGVTTGRFANLPVITSLCFMTTKGRHGHFGQQTGTHISTTWDVGFFAGFYGRAGFYLDGFGCYLKATLCQPKVDSLANLC